MQGIPGPREHESRIVEDLPRAVKPPALRPNPGPVAFVGLTPILSIDEDLDIAESAAENY
jgi:hypothetical protein